jgi:hypothetical protein
VKATVQTERLEDINGVFDRMRAGQIAGRVVLDFGNSFPAPQNLSKFNSSLVAHIFISTLC